MTSQGIELGPGDEVRSAKFGVGRVELDKGPTVIIRFGSKLEECAKSDLTRQWTPDQAISAPAWHAPLDVIVRAQAEAIQSVNNTWGVFSRSRIALLPHQLWVCRRVLERWPARWLVADDVGLGKTIEAGLVLWPLLASGTVRRLLVLCPASLVDQWQYRLREMFDIRLSIYATEVDTPRADFWNTHQQVVASLQTLRLDHRDRQGRLLESDPWDLLIVDEAHHLNADEQTGSTLGYKLVEELVKQGKVASMVFCTGTPHRGKDFGFWSLLRLLRPDLFDPRKPAAQQLPHLREVMIRNNKQNVTDLQGHRLFQPLHVTMEPYQYSEAEANFYHMLTEFIITGKAYASGLSAQDQRMVVLVLIAMQKLASSSVSAIRRALKNRLKRIADARQRFEQLSKERDLAKKRLLAEYEGLEQESDFDELNKKEEDELCQLLVQLMADEEPRLQELIAAADAVMEETKVRKIMDLLEERFPGVPVLLFTEYKATQSLVMSELIRRYGDGCVTFINGDNRAEDVIDASGRRHKFVETRQQAAERFNLGAVRFLVSTEAGGEGIDLQERCHVLFHVDLPWNPMRLHQRAGRLNRYGQPHQVQVVGLRNPDTVEALIWAKLDQKLNTIMRAFGHAMEDPEDLKQLVIGMTSPSLFRELFSEAPSRPPESVATWFDQKTARFGGRDVIETVREMVGHCASFDFAEVSPQIPRVDLKDLLPFLRAALTLNGRILREEDGKLAFRTPEAWAKDIGVKASYEGLTFDRHYKGPDANQRILGIGHPIINRALSWAELNEGRVATFSKSLLKNPLFIFQVTDSVTANSSVMSSVAVGVEAMPDGKEMQLIRDWELLFRLNALAEGRGVRRPRFSSPPEDIEGVRIALKHGQSFVESNLQELDLPYRVPTVTALAVFWPVEATSQSTPDDGEAGDADPA
jgi:SNF2 family DNA or RNA helicase